VDDVLFVGPRKAVCTAFEKFAQWIQYMGFDLGDTQRPDRKNATRGEALGWIIDTRAFNGCGSIELSGWKVESLHNTLDRAKVMKPGDREYFSLDEIAATVGRAIHVRTYTQQCIPSLIHLQKVEFAWRASKLAGGIIQYGQLAFNTMLELLDVIFKPCILLGTSVIPMGDRLLIYTDSSNTCTGGHEPGYPEMWYSFRDELNRKLIIAFGEGTSVIIGLLQAMKHRRVKNIRRHLIVYNDNEIVVATINKHRPGKASSEPWAAYLFGLCRNFNIVIQAIWLNTTENKIQAKFLVHSASGLCMSRVRGGSAYSRRLFSHAR